ncbi:MAG: aminotransferase class I/II-fold pyridoxal phosphate-dependent enzyme [Pseudomonadota bacterium]
MLSPQIAQLEDFAFARLARLLGDVRPATAGVDLGIGDPKGDPPDWLADVIATHRADWRGYPPPAGTPGLRRAIAAWLERRYAVAVDPDREILPVCGTKEALHLIAGIIVDPMAADPTAVLVPNPLYQTYVGGAVIAGAEPIALPATAETGFLPDLDALVPALLDRAAILFLCSPSNPQGAVAERAYWARALELARAHDVVLVADECYSEIHHGVPPPGALAAAAATSDGLRNLLAFNSLSKRSNAAGLRSGFVAGDARLIEAFLKVRRYGGATLPLPIQAASAALWADEGHVEAIRASYTAKLDAALQLLHGRFGAYRPSGGFFLWLDVGDGERAAAAVYAKTGHRILPGRYVCTAAADGSTPGDRYVRIALVHDPAITSTAIAQVADALEHS